MGSNWHRCRLTSSSRAQVRSIRSAPHRWSGCTTACAHMWSSYLLADIPVRSPLKRIGPGKPLSHVPTASCILRSQHEADRQGRASQAFRGSWPDGHASDWVQRDDRDWASVDTVHDVDETVAVLEADMTTLVRVPGVPCPSSPSHRIWAAVPR